MIALEVFGDKACFVKPGLDDVKQSFDFLTPSAAKGILESFYWHPHIHYVIDEIRVLEPIHFSTDVIEHHSEIGNGWLSGYELPEDQTERFEVLNHVRYLILAHYVLSGEERENVNSSKTMAILKRRVQRHKPFKTPCLGCRQYPCHYNWVDMKEVNDEKYKGIHMSGSFDLMLYDFSYEGRNKSPMWYHPVMKNGVVDLRNLTVICRGEETVVNKVKLQMDA